MNYEDFIECGHTFTKPPLAVRMVYNYQTMKNEPDEWTVEFNRNTASLAHGFCMFALAIEQEQIL